SVIASESVPPAPMLEMSVNGRCSNGVATGKHTFLSKSNPSQHESEGSEDQIHANEAGGAPAPRRISPIRLRSEQSWIGSAPNVRRCSDLRFRGAAARQSDADHPRPRRGTAAQQGPVCNR